MVYGRTMVLTIIFLSVASWVLALVTTLAFVGWAPIHLAGLLLSACGEKCGSHRFVLLGMVNAGSLAIVGIGAVLFRDSDSVFDETYWQWSGMIGFGLITLFNSAVGWQVWRYPLRHRAYYECRTCGYFLYGTTSGRCPECGTSAWFPGS